MNAAADQFSSVLAHPTRSKHASCVVETLRFSAAAVRISYTVWVQMNTRVHSPRHIAPTYLVIYWARCMHTDQPRWKIIGSRQWRWKRVTWMRVRYAFSRGAHCMSNVSNRWGLFLSFFWPVSVTLDCMTVSSFDGLRS